MFYFVQGAGINTVSKAVGTKMRLCLEVSGKSSRGIIEASFQEKPRFSKVQMNTVARCREW